MSILSDSEIRRFQDQMKIYGIGEEGQHKIRTANIAIIGAGGTGASALQCLSAAGIGFFGIIDFTLVDESNIQRQSLYGSTDIGKLKTIIAKQHLRDLFPSNHYDIINLQLNSSNAQSTLKPFDIVIDATNNIDSSIIIDNACEVLNKPLVYSYVNGCKVRLSVFHYKDGFSFKQTSIKNEYLTDGDTAVAYGFAGTFITSEVIKIVTGISNSLTGKIITFDCFDYSVIEETITKKN